MFEVGDHVVSTANGICEIKDVVEMEMSGSRKEYFLLIPESEANSKVYVPVDSAEKRIRKAMDKKSALSVIEQISDMEELIITNEKERETRYKEAVRSCDPKLLVGIIKNMYIRKQQRLAEGKKCTAMDEKYFKLAVHNLHAELAFALDCEESEVEALIRRRMEKTA